MIEDLIRNKNVLIAFSDPAGAKSVLSFAAFNRDKVNSLQAVSDRNHNFYQDFDINVETYKNKKPVEWLMTNRAEVLVTGTSFPLNLEVMLIKEAAKHSVLSISFIDHWVNMAKRFQTSDTLVLPDWICVIDERAHQIAISEGIPAERILVTGNPYHDFIASWVPKISREGMLASIGLPSDALYVLYAPEPISSTLGLEEKYGFTELDGIEIIYDAMREILGEKIYIIIKGHPNQKDEIFQDYVANQSDYRLLYFKNIDMNTISYYSECLFGFFSNSLVEAKILGKHVIRPLMMMNDGSVDSIKEMESSNFLSFYEKNKFVTAVHDYVRNISQPNL